MVQQTLITELHTLMNFFPVTSNRSAITQLLHYVEQRLEHKGMHIERIEHSGVKSLYASTRGQKHAKIMLQAHIDVVPEGVVFSTDGDKIMGRGCYDMLFGTASFLLLIDGLDNPASYDISILLTSDEEIGGANGIGTILDVEQYTCDVCVLPDAGDGLGEMSIAAKGIFRTKIKAQGLSHHASRPWEGDNAARKLIDFLTEMSQLFDPSDNSNSTYTISQLQAGNEALNQGPGEAYAGIDIRYTDRADYERIRKGFDALARTYHIDVITEGVSRSFSLDTETELVKRFIDLYEREVGTPITMTKAHGSSDARYFDEKKMPVIMFRPDGGNAHGDGEWLSYSSWQKFHAILEEYVTGTAKI